VQLPEIIRFSRRKQRKATVSPHPRPQSYRCKSFATFTKNNKRVCYFVNVYLLPVC